MLEPLNASDEHTTPMSKHIRTPGRHTLPQKCLVAFLLNWGREPSLQT